MFCLNSFKNHLPVIVSNAVLQALCSAFFFILCLDSPRNIINFGVFSFSISVSKCNLRLLTNVLFVSFNTLFLLKKLSNLYTLLSVCLNSCDL